STLLLPHYPFSCTTTSPPDIYTLSLHDALPILTRDVSLFGVSGLCPKIWRRHPSPEKWCQTPFFALFRASRGNGCQAPISRESRSEEHTSELQSRENLVCRLLLEKKKKNTTTNA